MRRVASVTVIALALLAASFASPVGAVAVSLIRPPYPVGLHSGAKPAPMPTRGGTVPTTRTPATAASAVTCDGQFDTVASPNAPNFNYLLSTSVVSASDVWAVGYSYDPHTASGSDMTLAEHWNGSSWTIVPTPNPGPYANDLTGVSANSSTDVWAVGSYQVDAAGQVIQTFAIHWNGNSWSANLSTPNPTALSFLNAVTTLSANDVWAVGTWWSAGYLPLAAHWNGSTWSSVPITNTTGASTKLFAVSAWSSTDVWAVGSAAPVGTTLQSLAYHWDGTSWTITPTPNTSTAQNNQIFDVAPLEPGHAVGVGYGIYPQDLSRLQSVAFDITTTGPGSTTNPYVTGMGNNELLAVTRVAGTTLWAGGYFRNMNTQPLYSLVEQATWNAATHALSWSQGSSSNPSAYNNVIFGMSAVSPYAFWATGYETSAGGVDQTLTELDCVPRLGISAPKAAADGGAFSITVKALNADDSTVTTYVHTVHFTSSDSLATLPADYSFVPGDLGSHTFSGVVLRTGNAQTITATDMNTPVTVPGSATVTVCLGACQAPAGPPGSRDTKPGPAGKLGGRGAANAPGAGTPGPRLPRHAIGLASRPTTSVSPVSCDNGFHFVSSPTGTGTSVLNATAVINAGDIWAVGTTAGGSGFNRTLAEHWNGSIWTIVSTPNFSAFDNDLLGVAAISTTDVWAIGAYGTSGNPPVANPKTMALHWDGVSWTQVATLDPTSWSVLLDVTAFSPTDVWAVGYDWNGAETLTLAEHWNGTVWAVTPTPSPNASLGDNYLFSVSAFSSTDVWATGETAVLRSPPLQSLAVHWNGTTWALVATPNVGAGASNEMIGVKALEAGHAVGVGYGNFVNGGAPRQWEAWDLLAAGGSTSAVGSGPGTGDSTLLGVAVSGLGVFAVGYWSNGAGPLQTLAIPATWNPTTHTFAWMAVAASESPSGISNVFNYVAAVSPYAFWAVGYDTSGANVVQTFTESYCAQHFVMSARASTPDNSPFSLTVTIKNGGGTTATGYRGTINFTSSDGSAVLPANYTFVAGDNGSHTFAGVVLKTGGSQTITVVDLAMPLTMPGLAIVVVCLGACQAPAGTAGSRSTINQSGAGTAAGRVGVNQSPAGSPGPRLPRPGTKPAVQVLARRR